MLVRIDPLTVLGEAATASAAVRPQVRGKFIFVGEQKLYLRGVTYGTFRPDEDGNEYHDEDVVDRDFALMAAQGLNAVRTYTVPPRWLLDCAHRHHLYVMIGLPWEQHITFLDDSSRARDIEARVRRGVRSCAGHPAVLSYAIGNEIPSQIVRWHGARRVERFLERLYRAVKAEDPEALVTYVNFPTTEYLRLPFIDFVTFNVYLESQDRLEAYLARLQNIAGDCPLVMAEIGLDSRRNGEEVQAKVLDWQIRTVFAAGCAGAFVFAWTDEWYRGGYDIEDWDFGLTTRDRQPKLALTTVGRAFAEVPAPADLAWPRISVVVCTYNGARTLSDCLNGLKRLDYPDYEVIVVDDGSTDACTSIAREAGVRVISTQNRGLSSARNTGLAAATGEIVAYTDDDARPDPHWLTYLAAAFMTSTHVGIGGPNIAPAGDGSIADCVANAPGGPMHVLLSDREAEHIPGCNMAFRKAALEAIGGFDPQFRTAGDDVDVCWRLQQQGWTLGFSPAAMVWHHRRNSVRAYWRQQIGYGKAEALLERKWPEKYNAAGHLAWAGRLYGRGLTEALNARRGRIYQGTWGSAPFQSLYQPAPTTLWSLPVMPEWYLVILVLAALSALSILWGPLLIALPLLVLAAGASVVQAGLSAGRASFADPSRSRWTVLGLYIVTTFLHLLQATARLRGRLGHGLTPWRSRGARRRALPRPRTTTIWSEHWRAPEEWLRSLEASLRAHGAPVLRGGHFDRWDLEVRSSLLGAGRLLMAIEEHGAEKQLARLRVWPRYPAVAVAPIILLVFLAGGAAFDGAWAVCALFAGIAGTIVVRATRDCMAAIAVAARPHPQLAANLHKVPSAPLAVQPAPLAVQPAPLAAPAWLRARAPSDAMSGQPATVLNPAMASDSGGILEAAGHD